MDENTKIYIAGHTGLIGSALEKRLRKKYKKILTVSHSNLDLFDLKAVRNFFKKFKPNIVFLAAGKAGNLNMCISNPASLYSINTNIQNNIFLAAKEFNIDNLVYFSSSCVYPLNSKQPIDENEFLNGKLEEATEGYAASKISGILACKAYNQEYYNNTAKFIAVVPNTVYGPNDHFDLKNSHVFSALLMRFYKAVEENADEVVLWGSGKPKREFIFSEDVADASIFLIENSKILQNIHYNIGTGIETSIEDLAEKIAQKTGFRGKILWDKSKHDGRDNKLLNSKKINELGWSPRVSLDEGLEETYKWYLGN